MKIVALTLLVLFAIFILVAFIIKIKEKITWRAAFKEVLEYFISIF